MPKKRKNTRKTKKTKSFMDTAKNTIEWIKGFNLKTLEALRYMLFFIVVADLFGVWWYLRLKQLSVAIMMIAIVLLALIIMRETVLRNEIEADKILKGGYKKMLKEEEELELDEEEDKKEEKPKKEQKDEYLDLGLDLSGSGLPDAEQYNKNLKKALGSMDF